MNINNRIFNKYKNLRLTLFVWKMKQNKINKIIQKKTFKNLKNLIRK